MRFAGKAQPEGVHSLVSVVDIQLGLQHLFPLKTEADVSAAIRAASTDRQITISALMPVHRSEYLPAPCVNRALTNQLLFDIPF